MPGSLSERGSVDGGQDITLDAKYEFEAEHAFLTGTQALVRAPLVQRRRDLARGLNTAGYITGYRGSPVGGYDSALWSAQKFLDQHHIKFQAGVNEDMAATACWGTQQVGMWQGATMTGCSPTGMVRDPALTGPAMP